ncbi:MAG: translocation/assembly module TamB domain-containing protein [Acetobacterales bacterium]
MAAKQPDKAVIPGRRRRRWPWVLAVLAGMVLLPVVAATVLFGTGAGRSWVAESISEFASSPDMQLRIDGLHGGLPGSIRLDSVIVADRDGEWLRLEDLSATWSPWALLEGRVDVGAATVGTATVVRAPATPAETDETRPGGGIPSELPVDIVVDSFAVETLRVEKAVFGAPATAHIEGSVAAVEGQLWRAALDATTRVEDAHGSLSVALAFDPRADSLQLDIRAADPAGGLIARLTGGEDSPAVDLVVSGDGPASDWDGRIRFALGGTEAFAADVAISARAERIAAEIDGTAFAGRWIDALPGPVGILLSAAYEPDAGRLTIDHAALERQGSHLVFDGTVELADQLVNGTLSLALEPDAAIAALAAPLRFGAVDAKLSVTGRLTQPAVAGPVTIRQIAGGGASVERLDSRLDLVPAEEGGMAWQIGLIAEAHGVAVPAPGVEPLLSQPVTAELLARIDAGAATATIQQARLAGAGWQVVMEEPIVLPAEPLQGTVRVSVQDIGRLPPLRGLIAGGDAGATVSLTAEGDTTTGTARVALSELQTTSEPLARLLGDSPVLTARIEANPERVAVRDLRLDAAGASAEGAVTADLAASTMDGELRASVPSLGRVLGEAAPVTGAVSVTARLSGPLDDPAANVAVDVADLAAAGLPARPASVRLDASSLVSGPRGEFSIRYGKEPLVVTASGQLALDDQALRVSGLRLDGAGVEASGMASVPLDAPAGMRAEIEVGATDLSRLGELLATPLEGGFAADVRIAPGDGAPAIEAAVTSDGLTVAGQRLDKVEIRAEGTAADLRTTFSVVGDGRDPPSVDAGLRAQRTGDGLLLTLTTLEGWWRDQTMRLPEPATVRIAGSTVDMPCTLLSIGDGEATLCLTLTETAIDARVAMEDMPLATVGALALERAISGSLDLELTLSGPLEAPEGRLQATVEAQPDLPADGMSAPALTLRTEARVADGMLRAEATAESAEGGLFKGRAEFTVPAAFSLRPFTAVVGDGSLDGRLTLDGDLGEINRYVPIEPHRIGGMLKANLNIGGTVDRPDVSGSAVLDDGRYENLTAGTLLTGITAKLVGNAARLELTNARAQDQSGGVVFADGAVRFDEGTPVADLKVTLESAQLVRRDDVTADISGTLALTGPPEDLLLEGDLVADPIEVRLIDSLPPNVATLKIANRDGAAAPEGQAEAEARAAKAEEAPVSGTLRIHISSPRRMYVRGRGLDSEWSGELNVTGSFADPEVSGRLQPVRGQFSFAGRTFSLDDSIITITGAEPEAVELGIKAVHETQDITAIISVTGSAAQPSVSLSSTPPLPRDEILARILFGRSTGQLSAVEALQLAESTRQLAGLGGAGGGVIERVREALGVDVLRFESGDDGGTTATAGKYVADGLFIGARQGLGPDSAQATITYEVTPRISLETDVGQNAQGRFGLKYHFDY